MFILSVADSKYRHFLFDISTLEDVMLGLTDNDVDAKRIANIAGNMLIGDVFSNASIYLKCVKEE